MKIKEEILGAIQILTQQAIQKICPTITFGIIKSIGNNKKCIVVVDGIEQNLTYYGGTKPIVNKKYPVFVPFSNMSLGFIITSDSNGDEGAFEFPIGYVYISTQNISPEITLGYGKWELIAQGDLSLIGSSTEPTVYAWERILDNSSIAGLAIAGIAIAQ